jgi:hypothetical protein
LPRHAFVNRENTPNVGPPAPRGFFGLDVDAESIE